VFEPHQLPGQPRTDGLSEASPGREALPARCNSTADLGLLDAGFSLSAQESCKLSKENLSGGV